MKKLFIGGIVILAALAITFCTIGSQLGNNNLVAIGIILGCVAVVILVLLLFYASKNMKSTSRSFEEFYRLGDYEGGIEYYQKKMEESQGASKCQCAYYLMTFYFLTNDLEKARDLFGDADFGQLYDYVLYYDILLDLYDGIVGEAREKYKIFIDSDHKELKERKDNLTQIFDFIDDKIDTISIKSDYPIMKEIIEKYADEEPLYSDNNIENTSLE